MHILSYFKTSDEAMYLAQSEDGFRWSEVNGGEAVLRSTVGTGQIRDPFVLQDTQGIWHAVWTDGWTSRSIGYARSRDGRVWQDQRLLPVMESLPGTQNTWAPEVFFDTAKGMYRILWSSTVREPGAPRERDHRIWSVTTADFTSVSEPSLFFDPGYNVIDACIVDAGDRYLMAYKDERGENRPDTDNKAIRTCYLAKDGSDRPAYSEPSPLITPALSEGPALYPVEVQGERRWVILYDCFTEGRYGGVMTDDCVRWEPLLDRLDLPEGVRHASVCQVRG